MLTREQIQTLIAIRNRPGSVLNPQGIAYRLPTDVIRKIANVGFDPDPNSDTATLLRLVAFGDLANVKAMLDANPALIGKAGHVVTPSGLLVRYVKPYECALGAGNFEMAKLIAGYFDQFTDGAEEKAAQDKKYLPHIEALAAQLESKQPTYDMTSLIQQIIDAPDSEVTAALNKSQDLNIPLCKAIHEFRGAVRPAGQQTAGLHYQHYTTILQVLDLLASKWQSLSKNYTNYARCDLVWDQLFGFLSRSLSFPERCALARACKDNEQTLVCKYNNQETFPESCDRSSEGSGLGFDFAIFGAVRGPLPAAPVGGVWGTLLDRAGACAALEKLCRTKTISLRRLCSQHPNHIHTKRRKVDASCVEMISEPNTMKL